jgi:tetratricopeptide (TPR) repeat protein
LLGDKSRGLEMLLANYRLKAVAIIAALICFFCSSNTSALADLLIDLKFCSGPNPNLDACTRAIHSGKLPLASLGLVHYVRGYAYLNAAQPEAASRDFTLAIFLRPQDLLPRIFRAQAYLTLHNYDEAINDCNFAIKTDPNDPAIQLCHFARGTALYYKGEYKAAITDLDAYIVESTDPGDAYLYRGSAKQGLGDKSGAIADYRREIESGRFEFAKKNARELLKALLDSTE